MILCDSSAAQDIVHDVFLEAWEHAASYDSARGQVKSWLMLRARSRSIDFRRGAGRARVNVVSDDFWARLADVSVGENAPDHEAVRGALLSLGIAVDVDHKGDAVQGRRTIPLETPLQIGAAGGNLVWAHRGGSVGGTLWPIDGEGDVEAARGAAELGDSAAATAVAVRHANAIWLGAATGHDSLSPSGGLSRLGGFGSTVGSPAVAINGGVVVAAWADRASSSDPWRLRWVRFKAGEAAGDPSTFIPPAGGRGVQSMSPSIAAIPGGRFLLVWTEGPATGHDVRALTLSRTGEPIGPPLDVSNKSANAGQGQAAVNASRQGLVAFLEATDSGFQVVATPIGCGL